MISRKSTTASWQINGSNWLFSACLSSSTRIIVLLTLNSWSKISREFWHISFRIAFMEYFMQVCFFSQKREVTSKCMWSVFDNAIKSV